MLDFTQRWTVSLVCSGEEGVVCMNEGNTLFGFPLKHTCSRVVTIYMNWVQIFTSVFTHKDGSVSWQSTWIKVSSFAYFCFCTTFFLELWRSTWFHISSIVYLWCRTLTYFEMLHSTWTIIANFCYYHFQTYYKSWVMTVYTNHKWQMCFIYIVLVWHTFNFNGLY